MKRRTATALQKASPLREDQFGTNIGFDVPSIL